MKKHLPLTRREILRFAAALPAALAATGARTAAADLAPPVPSAGQPPIVDAHLHCFAGAADSRFPYHPRAPYRPEKPASPERLLECMKGAGVDHAIVVHPEPYQDDHRYLEHCLMAGKERLKGTCLFFAESKGSVEALSALVKRDQRGSIVALRIHAYAPERLPPFGKPELRALWRAASDLGLAVQLHFEPRYAPGFEPLIAEFSHTPVIIDHLGRPFQGTPEEHAVVLHWARFQNTHIKLSALPLPTEYPHRDIAPVVRRTVEAFGADRLLYGGGFSAEATPESYRASRERIRSLIAELKVEEQAKVLGGTAAKLFGFQGR